LALGAGTGLVSLAAVAAGLLTARGVAAVPSPGTD
jgi:hypothetical protein